MLNDIKTLIEERRLPVSFQLKYHKFLFKGNLDKTLAQVLDTAPANTNPSSKSAIHLQVCERDVHMALLAIKSLLRFENNFCVIFHDDGSLSDTSIKAISEHVVDSILIGNTEAEELAKQHDIFEIREEFKTRFNLEEKFLYRIPSRINKIFDLHTFNNFEKNIYLDSDIIFQARPDRFLNWCKEDSPTAFYTVPDNRNILTSVDDIKQAYGDELVIHECFNSGFFGFTQADNINDVIKTTIDVLMKTPDIQIYGDESVWRLIYGHIKCQAFPYEEYPLFTNRQSIKWYQKNQSTVVYQHFLLKHYHGFYAEQAKKVLNQL